MHDDASPTNPTEGPRVLSALVDEVRRASAAVAAAEADRTRALAQAGHLALDVMAGQCASSRAAELALREVASDIAAAENLSDRTVQTQITRAMTLVDDYPDTLTAWQAGSLTRAHVNAILDIGRPLPVEVRHDVDALAAATAAEGLSPGRLRSRLAVLAERLHPTTLTERHQRGRDTRCVRIVTADDGMSDLIATLPTVLAVGIYDRLTTKPAPSSTTAPPPTRPPSRPPTNAPPRSFAPTSSPTSSSPPAPPPTPPAPTTAPAPSAPSAPASRSSSPPSPSSTPPAKTTTPPNSSATAPSTPPPPAPSPKQPPSPGTASSPTPSPAPSCTPTPTTAPPPSTATCAPATATADGPAAPPPPSAAKSTTPTTTPSAAPPTSTTSPTSANATTPRSNSPAGA